MCFHPTFATEDKISPILQNIVIKQARNDGQYPKDYILLDRPTIPLIFILQLRALFKINDLTVEVLSITANMDDLVGRVTTFELENKGKIFSS
jgi:hypothetical protein